MPQPNGQMDPRELLLHAICDSELIAFALVAGPDRTIEHTSPGFQALFAATPAGLEHRPFATLWPAEETRKLIPFLDEIEKNRRAGVLDDLEWVTPEGARRYFSLGASSLNSFAPGSLAVVAWEVTRLQQEQRLAEESAAEAERHANEMEAVFASMTEAVIIYDEAGAPRKANPAAYSRLGIHTNGVGLADLIEQLGIHRPGGQGVSQADLPSARALHGEVLQGEQFLLTTPAGKELSMRVSAAPLVRGGRITGAVTVWRDLTEQDELMERLEAEQATLNATFANAPAAILLADREGRITLANPLAERLLANPIPYGEDASTHAHFQARRPNGELYAPEDLPLYRAAVHGETHQDVELTIEQPGGELRHLLVNAAPILDRKGSRSGGIVVFQDISHRIQAEEEMRLSTLRSGMLAALSQAFAEAGLDYQMVSATVARTIARSLGDACIIRLLTEDRQSLQPVAFHHTDPQALAVLRDLLQQLPTGVETGPYAEVLQTGQASLAQDLDMEQIRSLVSPEFRGWVEHIQVRSLLMVPMRVHRTLIGILTVIRQAPGSRYTPEDQVFFQDVADRAAMAIENARLYAAEAQRARELDALHTATSALLTTLDLETLLSHILDAAMSAIPAAEKGALHLVALDTGQLQTRAVKGYSDPRLKNITLTRSRGLPVKAVLERRPLLVSDLQKEQPYLDDPENDSESTEVRSVMVVPLLHGEQALGAVSLDSSLPGAFSASDLRLLTSFATTTTMALENARLYSEVQKLAITDTLTGLYNRRGFFELGQREIERARRFARPLSAIMIDLDNFKSVNDNFGHAMGDYILFLLAERLRKLVREVDVLGRYGGDEFILLLPEADLFVASSVAERLRESLAAPIKITNQEGETAPIVVTASFGVAKATNLHPSLSSLIDRADAASYAAKHNGKNRVEVG